MSRFAGLPHITLQRRLKAAATAAEDRTRRSLALFLVGPIVIGTAAGAAAQDLRPTVFGALGVAKVYRTEDRNFGTELNVGGGAGIEWRRHGIDVDGHRTRMTPLTLQCGVVGVPCIGEAREGFEKATMLSGNVR